jgi:hypothetical protein
VFPFVFFVMRGLDPRIHPLGRLLRRLMDTRVKPAYDALFVVAEHIASFVPFRPGVIAARKFLRVNGGFSEPPS